MNATRALKVSIVMQWFFLVIGVSIGIYEESLLPEALQLFIQAETEKELATMEIAAFSVVIAFLFIDLFLSIAVYCLREWARKPYTYIVIVGALIYNVALGPSVISPVSGIFAYCSTLAIGISVALLYYSQVSEVFKKNL